MDYQSNIEIIYDRIVKCGFSCTREFTSQTDGAKLKFLYRALALNTKKPEIVAPDVFEKTPAAQIFSGSNDIASYREQFTRGKMKTVDQHKNGKTLGYGYYFSNAQSVADFYAKKNDENSTGGIIRVKAAEQTKFANFHDMYAVAPRKRDYNTPAVANFGAKQDAVNRILYDYAELGGNYCFLPIVAAVNGFAGIKHGTPKETTYVIADRSGLVTPADFTQPSLDKID